MTKKNNKGAVSAVLIIIIILIILGAFYLFGARDRSDYISTEPQNVTAPQIAGQPMVSTGAAAPVTQTTAVVTGEVNPNGGQTSYWYEYGTTNSLGSFTLPQLIGGGFATYSAPGTIGSLAPNTTYYYRLAAENQYGKVNGPIMSFQTQALVTGQVAAPPPPVFARPIVQTEDASDVTAISATLYGQVTANGANTVYWFEYGTTTALGTNTAITPGGTSRVPIQVTAVLPGLQSATTYYYRLNAQNVYGTAVGNISVFTTQPATPPPAPAGKAPTVITSAATLVTDRSATINGQLNPQGVATTYRFVYGKATSFGAFNLDKETPTQNAAAGSTSARVSANLTALDADATYYYQLVAENQYGTSRGSIFSFTTED
jgi:phosphodiesterase/alkaline phosphatase D-like protein